ncbi:hypothetical protein REISMN_06065 [Rickettsia tamurae subsp. buchneri]|uniref:Uncharacterized protein n=1 Tax=Rickettsia tamurae subsp. buchneri TaxID=1462938 RepID=A0A8E1BZV2_9RICK|nr:hypothetical protein REISMN_06065 [Rickettsia tamurae subsp. buchneri]
MNTIPTKILLIFAKKDLKIANQLEMSTKPSIFFDFIQGV